MRDRETENPRYCSQCGQAVTVAGAGFCKSCGAPLSNTRIFIRDPGFNPVLAFALSIVPGLGHVYKGRPGRGALWFIAVGAAYVTMGPLGPLLHFICAINAALQGALHDHVLGRRAPRREPMPSDQWQ